MRDNVVQQKGTDTWLQPVWMETGPAAPCFCAHVTFPGAAPCPWRLGMAMKCSQGPLEVQDAAEMKFKENCNLSNGR